MNKILQEIALRIYRCSKNCVITRYYGGHVNVWVPEGKLSDGCMQRGMQYGFFPPLFYLSSSWRLQFVAEHFTRLLPRIAASWRGSFSSSSQTVLNPVNAALSQGIGRQFDLDASHGNFPECSLSCYILWKLSSLSNYQLMVLRKYEMRRWNCSSDVR